MYILDISGSYNRYSQDLISFVPMPGERIYCACAHEIAHPSGGALGKVHAAHAASAEVSALFTAVLDFTWRLSLDFDIWIRGNAMG